MIKLADIEPDRVVGYAKNIGLITNSYRSVFYGRIKPEKILTDRLLKVVEAVPTPITTSKRNIVKEAVTAENLAEFILEYVIPSITHNVPIVIHEDDLPLIYTAFYQIPKEMLQVKLIINRGYEDTDEATTFREVGSKVKLTTIIETDRSRETATLHDTYEEAITEVLPKLPALTSFIITAYKPQPWERGSYVVVRDYQYNACADEDDLDVHKKFHTIEQGVLELYYNPPTISGKVYQILVRDRVVVVQLLVTKPTECQVRLIRSMNSM